MKHTFALFAGLILLAVLISGCTSQTAPAPATPAPAAPQQTITAAPVITSAHDAIVSKKWQLGWYDDTKGMWSKVAEGSTITATFSPDFKLTGFSGCSDYATTYEFGQATNQILIKRPPVSSKTCQTPNGVMTQESEYFTDLEWTQTYSITNGQLLLFNKDGRKIVQFDPAP